MPSPQLLVSLYRREEDAWSRVVDISEAAGREELDVHDVSAVVRRPDGSICIREARDVTPADADPWGASWGFLAGAFLSFPIAAAFVGGGAAVLAAHRRDWGVTEDFEEEVASRFEPGTTAVIAVVDEDSTRGARRRLAAGARWIDTLALHALSMASDAQQPRGSGGAVNVTRSSRATSRSTTEPAEVSSTWTGAP